jgi:hypothetical protein
VRLIDEQKPPAEPLDMGPSGRAASSRHAASVSEPAPHDLAGGQVLVDRSALVEPIRQRRVAASAPSPDKGRRPAPWRPRRVYRGSTARSSRYPASMNALDTRPVISWINLVEVHYRIERDHGREFADEILGSLRASFRAELPATVRMIQAARLKVSRRDHSGRLLRGRDGRGARPHAPHRRRAARFSGSAVCARRFTRVIARVRKGTLRT